VCEVKKQDCYILEKNMLEWSAKIIKNFETIFEWTLQVAKQKIKELV
jgi:hypothetical protein